MPPMGSCGEDLEACCIGEVPYMGDKRVCCRVNMGDCERFRISMISCSKFWIRLAITESSIRVGLT
eukprot:CAMPEP_0183466878 /NCGR_PEP_ID=MMETSP0370-20130417/149902_1 /TAXON_ID=268820 /ORGANISM="Peridinium aciculiferum, Strain PAER-2" /LENGTH=65 /DNA_ID=CAMNT_0025659177 /DNA_START=6 /DNA_END=199 /DNA_ORIENTATION=+